MALMGRLFSCLPLALALCSGSASADSPIVRLDEPAFYPEGPTVHRGNLYWAEMSADRIRKHDGTTATTVWQRTGCGPTAVKSDGHGGFWALCHLAHRVLHLNGDFTLRAEITHAEDGSAISWPNDAAVDENGWLYVTSAGIFDLAAPATGTIYFIDLKYRAVRVAGGLRYANGIYLDKKRNHLYVSEHLNRRVHLFALNASGKVKNHGVFFDFRDLPGPIASYPQAGPDGLLLRATGELLIAEYGAGRIIVVSEQRKFVKQITVPMQFVTNMTLWPDQKTLVVTGAFRNDVPPLPGRVISFRLD